SLKYKVLYFAGALVHILFFVIFSVCHFPKLMVFNIFSVLLYFLGGVFAEKEAFEKNAYLWLVAMYIEVTAHGVLATVVLGTQVEFYLYILIALPMAGYTLFFVCKPKKYWGTICTMVAVSFLALFLTIYYVMRYGPTGRPLTAVETNVMSGINIGFSFVLLAGFSALFLIELTTLINKINRTNAQLEYTATHDALTGLYNRHSLRTFFGTLAGQKFCVMLGDIDDFKKVNDTYGHDCGDAVLKTVAEAISSGLFKGDLVCRWGGEEILIILQGGRLDCLSRAREIRENVLERRVDHNGTIVKITMTFGFVDSSELGADAFHDNVSHIEALISLADKRLYKGKTNGKNKIVDKS
ncbi:MAG: GGDEF domain-containing protein, partial [Oscillospiraceae bacterium]